MKTTIQDVSQHHCSGCGACMNVCPFGAISMKENSEGFLFPVINSEKCTKCGLCYNRCPSVKFDDFFIETPTVYGMMAHDDIRETSSSGGMFSLLSEYVFSHNGIVCGVANTETFKLEFVFAENMEQLESIKGSKYYQAEVGNTYQKIKWYLDKGRTLLFCACPCQVAALKKFLGRAYGNLITADVVCHGVPSHLAVEQYVKTLADLDEVDALKFRDKAVYKWSSNIALYKKNGEIIRKHFNESTFYRAFGAGLPMRESCYNCKFARTARVGDFTLGDFWHISEFHQDLNDYNGTSSVFLNNEKAKAIYQTIEPKMYKSYQMPLENAIRYNTQLREPVIRHPARDVFYQLIKNGDFDQVVDNLLKRNHFDVGIAGYWYATNYGSVITYYSLYKAIEAMGYKTVILDRPDKHLDGEPQTVFARVFMNKFANISDSYPYFEQGNYDRLCDKYVVGSDQVWTPGAICDAGYRFFLDFVSDDKTKVAYAPSFGQDKFEARSETKKIVSYLLSRFDAVSVRENTGVDICEREFNIDAVQMIDPIFLNNREFYDRIAEYSNKRIETPYVLSYILDPDESKRNMLLKTQEEKGLTLVNLLDGRYGTFDRNNEKLNLPNTLKDVNEEEWIRLFRDSDFVITDSHHGFAMAVIFNKPVICIMNKSRGGTRFTSLLGWLGMLDRLVDKDEDINEKKYLFGEYDYSAVNQVIETKRAEALRWLSDSLKIDHAGAPAGLYDFVRGKLGEMERKISDLYNKNHELQRQLNDRK
ncbi:MAG: polysaccharide pyruvyl transferase family protein [Clostridia bacterium]|nr:polysaccharide pyruvyl transferase family protein [Clostridia bacterium]